MKQKAQNDKELAALYGCSRKTISRWRLAKAPLHDPAAMREWLASRRVLPPGTQTRVSPPSVRHATDTAADLNPGAPGAHRRLARAELSAYQDYQDALESGDALAIRSTKAAWLSITETLRKAGAQLDANEVQLGDMVPRSVVERFITAIGNALRCACYQAPTELCGENMMRLGPEKAGMILRDQLFARFHAAFAAVLQIPHGAPKWMCAALLEHDSADVRAFWEEHADMLREWISIHDHNEFVRHVQKECFERKSTAEWLAHLEECRRGNFKTLPDAGQFFS